MQTQKLTPETLEESVSLLNTFHGSPLFFNEEKERNAILFSRVNAAAMQSIKLCNLQIEKIRTVRDEAVKTENFEKAAQMRDEERKIHEQINGELIIGNGFTEGFNVFQDRLLIVWPQKAHQKEVLKKMLEMQETQQTGAAP